MKKRNKLTAFTILTLLVALLAIGCSSDESSSDGDKVIAEVLDTATDAISTEIANAVVNELDINSEIEDETVIADPPSDESIQSFVDVLVQNQKLYAVGDNSLYIYDYKAKTEQQIVTEDVLYAVAFYDGSIYVGGDQLYKLNDTSLEYVDDDFDGTITELYNYGYQLMIGTSNGLYRRGIFGKDKLMDDVTVSAITEDNSGLWIGTLGEGLYRWDGENFNQRFLRRDTTLFDFVNAVDFKHNHLYVGCDNGLYVYDGGSWKTLTTEEGLIDNNVRAIDATDWTVYIGTDKGVVGYFENELTPVNLLDTKQVNDLQVRGRKLIAATEYDGVVEKNGNSLKTLIEPFLLENLQILSLIP